MHARREAGQSRKVAMTQPNPTPPGDPTPPTQPDPAPPSAPADNPLGPGGEKALAAERNARQALEKQLADLRTGLAGALGVEVDKKTDIQALTERIAAQEQRASAAELRALRLEVAQEKGLTVAQAARLVGATKEELAADAEALLALFPAGATPAGGTPGATPSEPAPPKAPAPDPSQGPKQPTTARPTSLGQAVTNALKKA